MTNDEGMTKSEAQKPVPELKLEARELWMEATELRLILSKIWRGRKNE
jgi:hypothetical protein